MAPRSDEELSDHVDRIRADIAALSETVRQLVGDTAGIQATLKQRVGSAAKQAAHAGGDILGEAGALGEEAVEAAARGATAAVDSIETQIGSQRSRRRSGRPADGSRLPRSAGYCSFWPRVSRSPRARCGLPA